jgi:sugar porter (SP) family MFS transporter
MSTTVSVPQQSILYVLMSAIIAALGGLLFGFDVAVISGTTDDLKRVFQLNDLWLGVTVASALWGTIIGALIAGYPSDHWGRWWTLSMISLLYFISALGSAAPYDWPSFLFFRFIGGIGVGIASVVCPLYIAEIAPADRRGRLVALAQFNIVFGILLAYLSNYAIGQMDLGDDAWRYMFGMEAIPAALFFILLFFTLESPRWLIAKDRIKEAHHNLTLLGTPDADTEIAVIQQAIEAEQQLTHERLFSGKYRRTILLAIAIAAFNQLSGINAIIYYTADIFKLAGYDRTNALMQSAIIGLTNLVFTMAGLSLIDYFGRRKLMLCCSIGYIISLSAAAYSYYNHISGALLLGSLILFIASHAFGQGAVIWVFLSEIFPNSVRARGVALGSTVHWVMATIISSTFPYFAAYSPGHIFTFYAVCMVGQLIWVLTVMPETKGVPLEQIQEELNHL